MIVAVLCLMGVRQALAAPPFEQAFPETTLLYCQVKDLPSLAEKIKTHSVYDLWNEPGVQKFLEAPLERLRTEIEEAEGKAEMQFSEIRSLFKGDIALAISGSPRDPEPEVVLVFNVGTEGDRAMGIVGKVLAKLTEEVEEDLNTVEESYEGATLMQVKGPDGEAAFTYGVADDVFVLGRPHEVIKRTVSFLKNPPNRSLGNSSLYKAALNKVSPKSDISFFFNLAHLFSLLKQESPEEAGRVLEALGVSGVSAAAMGVEVGSDYDTTRMFVKSAPPPKGIMKMVQPAPGPLHTGAEATPDAEAFGSIRLDMLSVWDEFERLLATLSPQTLAAMNQQIALISAQIGQPFNIRNDIMSAFGQRMAYYTRYEKPYSLHTSQQTVILVDINSKAAFDQAMAKLRQAVPMIFAMFQQENYMGYELYVFGMPMQPGAPPGMAAVPKPAYVATENQLLFSMQAEALKAHLRRMGKGGPSLKDTPDFQEALKMLPTEGRIMFAYSNPVAQIEMLLEALRSGQFLGILAFMERDPDVAEFLDLFDMSLLPESKEVTKHLVPSAGCVVVQPDGLLIISRAPARAQQP